MLVITDAEVLMDQSAPDKQTAITTLATLLAERGMVRPNYLAGMLAREQQQSTYLGSGIAIPHGTVDTRDDVIKTALQVIHFPSGVVWGDDGERAYVAIGIAARSSEHLAVLQQLTRVLCVTGLEERLRDARNAQEITDLLNGKTGTLAFDPKLVTIGLPVDNMSELVSLAAGKLYHRKAVTADFIAQLLQRPPTHVSQGLWLVACNQGVHQSACTIAVVATPFQYDDNHVAALMVIAGKDHTFLPLLDRLATVVFNGQAKQLLCADASSIVAQLTHVKAANGARGTFTIKNPHGLHARPSAILLSAIKPFPNPVWVEKLSGETVDARILANLMGLGVHAGSKVTFVVEGEGREEVLKAIKNIIDAGLGEPL